ncbi:type II toxin-antitoxin system VapC family toxin [uncultured Sphingomonas sp.]
MHPAALNMGDCFAYASTRRHADTILFKGEDFALTDLKDATLE